jgi:hypothetical protein
MTLMTFATTPYPVQKDDMKEGDAPDRILELSYAFYGSKALLSAVELGLFSELAKRPLDAESLRKRLGTA